MNFKIIFTLLAIVAVLAFVMPIDSSHEDLYVSIVVYEPLLGSPSIQDVQTTQSPHTIFQMPQVPQFLKLAPLVGSGALKVRLDTETSGESVSISSVGRTKSDTFGLVLADVPVSDSTLKITLFEDNNQVDTRTINLAEFI